MEKRATPPRRVTSPTWGPPPPCKQALNVFPTICKQDIQLFVEKFNFYQCLSSYLDKRKTVAFKV